jgi:putative PIN family toxin of toxin-antitoxin system
MTHAIHHVVYDCVVFAQALISPGGPSGECVNRARRGDVQLFVSEYLVNEIRELDRKIPAKYGVTSQQVNDLADQIILFGTFISIVPSVYQHPHDADDSHYVDLAVATDSTLIVSRDRHLLNLMDLNRLEAKDFQRRFPGLTVLTPEDFVRQLRAEDKA